MRSQRIARNSVLSLLDSFAGVVMSFLTAGVVARALGPSTMGKYAFAMWLAYTLSAMSSHSVGSMLAKFLAEFLGRGEVAVGRSMVRQALRIQIVTATLLVAASMAYVWWRVPEGEQLYNALVLLTIFPGMIIPVPTALNAATENFAGNVIPSLCSIALQPLGIFLALGLKWKLTGLALGFLISRVVDVALRLWLVRNTFPTDMPAVPIPADLKLRMWRFCWRSTALLGLDLIVWERSEVFMLKEFSSPDQVAFYSTGFSFCAIVQSLPTSFASAASASLLVQRGSDPQGLNRSVMTTLRYLVLMVLPVTLGLAALSGPVIRVIFGSAYAPAIPVLALMVVFAIPKAVYSPVYTLLSAIEKQGFMLSWMIFSAILTLGLDYSFIPRYGAMGAAWGNGLAQLAASAGIWVYGARLERLRLPWKQISGMVLSAALMGGVAFSCTLFLPSWAAILVAVPAGALLYGVFLRLLGSFAPEDLPRFLQLGSRLPAPLAGWYESGLRWVAG